MGTMSDDDDGVQWPEGHSPRPGLTVFEGGKADEVPAPALVVSGEQHQRLFMLQQANTILGERMVEDLLIAANWLVTGQSLDMVPWEHLDEQKIRGMVIEERDLASWLPPSAPS